MERKREFGEGFLTDRIVLESPKTRKEFESKAGQKWAREIVVDYYTRTEPGWLLGPCVKILTVIAKDNPTPGGLSRSYLLDVFYKIGQVMTQEHWFVKIPQSLQTVAMDERELVMYNTIFPRLQVFLSNLDEDEPADLPIPIIYFSSFLGDGVHDCLVTENLCQNGYFQAHNDTTKLAYMRAAMSSLANVHGITFSFMKSLGGKEQLMAEFPTIREQVLPKSKIIRNQINDLVLPFLMYVARTQPDIAQQAMVLAKFHKFLFRVFKELQNKEALKKLMTLVHGDAKLDNFLFKKKGSTADDAYSAMIIDWQGCGFDLVSNDLMWCLYGFIKNLPETGDMIHGFVEYSLVTYWDELKKVLKCFGDKCDDFGIPNDSEWAAELIKEGFTLEFMKNALIRPVLSLRNKELLCSWWKRVEGGEHDAPPPPEKEIFKSENYSNFIYLFFKIGTEVNVFAHLGKALFTHMKEAMFSDSTAADSDSDDGAEDTFVNISESNDANPSSENTSKCDSNGVELKTTVDSDVVDSNDQRDIPADVTEKKVDMTGDEVEDEKVDKQTESPQTTSEFTENTEKPKDSEPKTVTSMYGKVYQLKS